MKYWIESHPVGAPDCCGDFVGSWELAPNRSAIVVGDVAGRGREAGEAAAALRARVRELLVGGVPLAAILRIVSDTFTESVMKAATPFASLFVAILDGRNGTMRYASAGHEPGLLFSRGGRHRHLEPTGPVLGVPALPVFRERSLPLLADDMLVVVTDGVTEARRSESDELIFFGSSGVVRAVTAALRQGHDPARTICQAAFEYAGQLVDDASVLVLRATFSERLRFAQESFE